MVRVTGARDLALGAGALVALQSNVDDRPWSAAHLVADGTDFAATWIARRELARARTTYALFMAGASAAIAGPYVVQRSRGEDAPSTAGATMPYARTALARARQRRRLGRRLTPSLSPRGCTRRLLFTHRRPGGCLGRLCRVV
jgi:hypothetical protein